MGLLQELHRRRVLRTAGYYVIAAWSLLQVADVVFPGFGIPDSAIQVLVWAAFAGFPIALIFGWLFDLGPGGIRRTPPAGADEKAAAVRLGKRDLGLMAALLVVFALVVVGVGREASERMDAAPGDSAETTATARITQMLENSIAVLPFDNVTPDPDNAYFCDGVADEILNSLGRFSELNVIGRTSSFAFRYDRPPANEISAILGAKFLLQGSVRILGDRLRISTQLLDARGVQLWSATFDRLMDNVFKLQAEIAEQVAVVVAPKVSGASMPATPLPEAYDLYLRGREALNRRDAATARGQFRQAVALDPNFAAAHSELAITLAMGSVRDEEAVQAADAIATAKSLVPGQARALAAEGLLYLTDQKYDPQRAEASLRAALQTEPSMVDALNWLASSLYRQGKDDEGDAVLRRALRIDPLHPVIVTNYANSLKNRGESDAAETVVRRLLDGPRKHRWAFEFFAVLYAEQGRLADSYTMTARQLQETPPLYHGHQADAEYRLGRWERANYWAGVDKRRSEQSDDPRLRVTLPLWESIAPMLRGRFDEAYRIQRADFAALDLDFGDLPPVVVALAATVPALAGDCDRVMPHLERIFPRGNLAKAANDANGDGNFTRAAHVLAWCRQRRAETSADDELLAAMEEDFLGEPKVGLTSTNWFTAAVTASLRGEADLAVERFERAVALGWRSLNVHAHEPMWTELRQDPRVKPLLQKVREDIEEQRRLAQQRDTEWDPIEWHRQQQAAPAGS